MDVDDTDLPELIDTNAIVVAQELHAQNASACQNNTSGNEAISAIPDMTEVIGKRRTRKIKHAQLHAATHANGSDTRQLAHGPRGENRSAADTRADVDMPDVSQKASSRRVVLKETDTRRIPVPAHRYTPLRENWLKLFQPVVEQLKLQMRFNLKTRCVEIRRSPQTTDVSHLQKAADFIRAFTLGFEIDDALALIRLEDLFMESFEIQDVKPLKGDHLSRAIGRLAGKGGRTKFTIENATKTRIVLADQKIHILGSFNNIKVARNSICSLILGSPPSKVYGQMRSVSKRINERL